jgi:deazaflavin-dependent oxidoreductase (nitroreductase family)
MTSEPNNAASSPQPTAQTLPIQGFANVIVKGLLHVPLVARAVGSRLVIVYVVGRKSGRRYSVPVAYTKNGDALLIGTPFGWGRNLRTGEPVDIRFMGRRRTADVQVYTDEAGVAEQYTVMSKDNRQFARFNKIGIDADGNVNANDLRAAWVGGARAFRLTPR